MDKTEEINEKNVTSSYLEQLEKVFENLNHEERNNLISWLRKNNFTKEMIASVEKDGRLLELVRNAGISDFVMETVATTGLRRLLAQTETALDDMTIMQEFKRRKLNLKEGNLMNDEDLFLPLYNFLKKIQPNEMVEGSFIFLPESFSWFNGGLHPMLIRKCYVDLFKNCVRYNELGFQGLVITGNPGIGKSYFLFYCLLNFVFLQKKTVLLHLIKNNLCWIVSPDRFLPVVANVNVLKTVDVYLFDAGLPRQEPLDVTTFTIISSSPNNANFQGWLKDGKKTKIYMPCWDEKELQEMNGNYHKLTQDELSSRFSLYDGIPRYVFSSTPDRVQKQLTEALSTCEPSHIQNCITNHTVDDDISHKIIKIEVNDDYTSCTYKFASKFVEETFPETIVSKAFDTALALVKYSLVNFPEAASLRGNLFGQLAHNILSSGGQFKISGGSLNIEKLERVVINKALNDIESGDILKNVYVIPKKKNFAVFDSFYWRVDCLLAFQFTVSTSHSYSEDKVDKFLEKAEIDKLEVYFVVPSDIFGKFTLPKGASVDGSVKLYKLCLWEYFSKERDFRMRKI